MLRTTLALAATPLILSRAFRTTRRLPLSEKVVVVTGTDALSLAIASVLGRVGAKLCLIDRDSRELEEACDSLKSEAIGIAAKLDDEKSCTTAIESCLAHFGHIDAVVSIGSEGHGIDGAFASGFFGPMRVVQAVLPHMRGRKSGRVAIVAVNGEDAAQAASASALIGWSQAMRGELMGDGICVTTACGVLGQVNEDIAAHRIVDALRHGDPSITLSLKTKLFGVAQAVAPGLFADALALFERFGPEAEQTLATDDLALKRKQRRPRGKQTTARA